MPSVSPSLDRFVVANAAVRAGKPCVAGTRISVSDVASMHLRQGRSLAEIAGAFDLDLSAVHAAMAYYYDHRDEIEQTIERDRTLGEELAAVSSSPLREKLAQTRGG